MTMRDIINIYNETLDMLKNHVLSTKCTINDVIQYSACQFSLRKFEMLRFLKNQEKRYEDDLTQSQDNREALTINIKDYYDLRDTSIEHELITLLSSYLHQKSDKIVRKIKILFKYFKVVFQVNYLDTITKIIKMAKFRII